MPSAGQSFPVTPTTAESSTGVDPPRPIGNNGLTGSGDGGSTSRGCTVPLHDEDIITIVNAEVGEEEFAEMLAMAGVPSTGNTVEDLRAMAFAMDVEVEDLLYALFVEDEPLFNDSTWANLTNDEEYP